MFKKVHLFLFLTLLLSVQCGRKSSSLSNNEPPRGDLEGTYNDPSGFLVFAPPPGTYENTVRVVVRPRAVSAVDTAMSFEILNTHVESCSEEGPRAVCFKVTRTKTIEYVVIVTRKVGDKIHTAQQPYILRYEIRNAEPTPTPSPSPTPVPTATPTPEPPPPASASLDGQAFQVFHTICSGYGDRTVAVGLLSTEVIGEGKVVWFEFPLRNFGSQALQLVATNGAYLKEIRGTGDTANTGSTVAQLKDTTCTIDLRDNFAKVGDVSCTVVRTDPVKGVFLKNEATKIEIKNWRCNGI